MERSQPKIKEGYKQTDVGIIPEDWEGKTIGDVITFSGGSQPPLSTFLHEQKEDYIRLIQIRDYKTNEFATYIPESLAKKRCSKDDIMIGRYGPPVFQILRGLEGAYNVALLKAIPSELIDKEFLFYFLKQKSLFKVIEALSQRSSGQTGVDMDGLRNYPLPLPPLPEQKAIAEVLSDMDALITSLDQLITKKHNIKQGAMQLLLTGKKRLAGFSGDWETKKLGEIGDCIRGVSYNGDEDLSAHDTDTTFRLFRSNNIQNSKIDFSRLQFVSREKVKSIQLMQPKDVLICMANGSKELVGKSALFHPIDSYQYTFGAFMGCYRVYSKDADNEFVFYNFHSYNYRSYIDILLSGSSINNLKPSDVESIEIPSPQIEEQKAIAQILSDMDAEIEALEKKREKYKAIKQGMMQELLTGKTRLVGKL